MLIRVAMSTTIPAQALAASASTQHNAAPGFKVLSASRNARTGILTTRSGDILTPGMLMYTRRGGPLALTADMVEKLDPLVQGVQVDIMQL